MGIWWIDCVIWQKQLILEGLCSSYGPNLVYSQEKSRNYMISPLEHMGQIHYVEKRNLVNNAN